MQLKADRRLYVTADRAAIVEEGDPRSAYLLASAGKVLGDGDVAKYSLELDEHDRVVYPGLELGAPPPPDVEGLLARRNALRTQLEQLEQRGERLFQELRDVEDELEDAEHSERNDAASRAGGLPEDIPGRDALVAAGLVTLEAVLDVADLTKIDGIGKATAEKIGAYLEARDE